MSSLVTAELGSKENPHPILPPTVKRTIGHYYINNKREICVWVLSKNNNKYLINVSANESKLKKNCTEEDWKKKLQAVRVYRKTRPKSKYMRKKLTYEEKLAKNFKKRKYYRHRSLMTGIGWNGKKKLTKEQKRERNQTILYRGNPLKRHIHQLLIRKPYDTRVKIGRIKFDLTLEYILKLWEKQKGICALSGLKMNTKINSDNIMSIDRIDSKNGNYIEGDIQLVCSCVNIIKNKYLEEDFIEWCDKVALYRGNAGRRIKELEKENARLKELLKENKLN